MAQYQHADLLYTLKTAPQTVIWSKPYIARIEKLTDGSLGIVVNTYLIPGSKETCTVVTSVKPECNQTNNPNFLKIGFRIIDVNGHDITGLKFNDVIRVLSNCKERTNVITFVITKPIDFQLNKENLALSAKQTQQPAHQQGQTRSRGSNSNNNHVIPQQNVDNINLDNFNQIAVASSVSGLRSYQDTTLVVPLPSQHHSYYKTQASTGSDLTPVEAPETSIDLSDENTPLMADFRDNKTISLDRRKETDADVIEEVLHYPWNIRWSSTEKIILKKDNVNDRVGFYYKIKKTTRNATDSGDMFYLVEEVHANSPSYGKLRKGDWIRSINGTPITDDVEMLKREISKSTEVSMVIQRPKEILHYPPKSKTKKSKENQITDSLISIPNQPRRSTERSISDPNELSPPSINHLELDDIKIDGMSVYNMLPTEDQLPFEVDENLMSSNTIQTFLGGSKIKNNKSKQVNNTKTELHKKRGDILGISHVNDPPTQAGAEFKSKIRQKTKESCGSSYDTNTLLYQCLDRVAKSDLEKLPYIRINQISTSDCERHHRITKKLMTSLEVKHKDELAGKHLFQLHKCILEPARLNGGNNTLHNWCVEDLILAKNIAIELRADIASEESVDKKLSKLKTELCSSKDTLCGIPVHLIGESFQISHEQSFVELEMKNFTFSEIVSLWPAVYFTSNSIFVVVFDLNKLMTNEEEEMNRILTCINLIRSSSAKTAIYLVSEKQNGTKLSEVMPTLQSLEDALKHSCEKANNMCSNCTCDISKVPFDFFNQIQKNPISEHAFFLADKIRDWNELVSSIKDQLCKRDFIDMKYPKSALVASKIMMKEEMSSVITKPFFKQNILSQLVFSNHNDAVSDSFVEKNLVAMHHCGKIIYQAQVAHRTSHSPFLDIFICCKPDAMTQWFDLILQHTSKLLGTGRTSLTQVTATTFPNKVIQKPVLESVLHAIKEELPVILSLLELYHIIEPADSSRKDYYFTPSFYPVHDGHMSNERNQVSSFKVEDTLRKLYIDFHGFLPINMCLSILSKVEDHVKDHVQILDMFKGYYMHESTKFELNLMPLKGMAEVTVKLKPNELGEKFYSFIRGVFSKAITTNLLTYHIGPACKVHLPSAPVVTSESLVGSHVQVLDMEQERSLTHSPIEELDFWKASKRNGPPGPLTPIQAVPLSLLEIIYRGLNMGDALGQGRNWKKLAELLKYGDLRTLNRLSLTSNPCKNLLDEYMNSEMCKTHEFTLDFLLRLICHSENGMQRKDIYSDICIWMKHNDTQNWMQNGGTYH